MFQGHHRGGDSVYAFYVERAAANELNGPRLWQMTSADERHLNECVHSDGSETTQEKFRR